MGFWERVYHTIEQIIDFLIWPTILTLLAVIIIELGFQNLADKYHHAIVNIDYSILGIFVADLFFKYMRVRNIKRFVKENWLDIIAVFPFFLLFRILEPLLFAFSDLQKEAKTAQLIFHESLEISKSSTRIAHEVEAAGKISRTRTIVSAFRTAGRSPRFLKAAPFFEKPVPNKRKKLTKKK